MTTSLRSNVRWGLIIIAVVIVVGTIVLAWKWQWPPGVYPPKSSAKAQQAASAPSAAQGTGTGKGAAASQRPEPPKDPSKDDLDFDHPGWFAAAGWEFVFVCAGVVLGSVVARLLKLGWFDMRLARAGLFPYVAQQQFIKAKAAKHKVKMVSQMRQAPSSDDMAQAAENVQYAAQVRDAAAGKKKPSEIPDAKILQPEYAIGQGLISRDDYNAIQSEYLAQSDLTSGLIIPLALLLFAMVCTPQMFSFHLDWWILMGLGAISGTLLFFGLERRQKYRVELQSLILGKWEKLQKQKPAPTPDPTTQATKVHKRRLETVSKVDPETHEMEVQEQRKIFEDWTKIEDPPKAKKSPDEPEKPKSPSTGDSSS